MRNQHFWLEILLCAVYLLPLTTALPGVDIRPAGPRMNVPHTYNSGRNTLAVISDIVLKQHKLNTAYRYATKQTSGLNPAFRHATMQTSSEVTPHGNEEVSEVLKDTQQSYSKMFNEKINSKNYPYVLQEDKASDKATKLPNGHENTNSHHLSAAGRELSEPPSYYIHLHNTSEHKRMRKRTGSQVKMRMMRSVEDILPFNKERSNITSSDLIEDTQADVDNNILSSDDSKRTTVPDDTDFSFEAVGVNSKPSNELNHEITTVFSNVIPRDPINHISSAPPEKVTTNQIEFQASMKDSMRIWQVDNSKVNASSAVNTGSSSPKHNQSISESFHESESQYKKLTNLISSSEKYSNTDDVSANTKDIVKLTRELPEDDENKTTSGANELMNGIFLEISLSSSGDSMMVNWIYVSNNTQVSGFQVSYRMNKREDFDSASLDISVRSFALHSLHEDEHYVICVHAMVNSTVVKSSCAEWSRSSMKMVVGILAGTIFLVPCIIVMIFILYKDYKMTQKNRLQLINKHATTGRRQLIAHKNPAHIHPEGYHDEVEDTDSVKADVKLGTPQLPRAYAHQSVNNATHDTGHENPCEHAADDSTDDDDAREPWKALSRQEAAMITNPLDNQQLSSSSTAAITSKNNVTYIMIRRNCGPSNDNNSQPTVQGQGLPVSQDTVQSTSNSFSMTL